MDREREQINELWFVGTADGIRCRTDMKLTRLTNYTSPVGHKENMPTHGPTENSSSSSLFFPSPKRPCFGQDFEKK